MFPKMRLKCRGKRFNAGLEILDNIVTETVPDSLLITGLSVLTSKQSIWKRTQCTVGSLYNPIIPYPDCKLGKGEAVVKVWK
jgi:hypothetical protein